MRTKTIDTKGSEAIIIRTPNLERFLKEIEPFKTLSQAEERELIQRAQHGCAKSRENLIKCNLKFLVCCAKEYQKYGIEINDLINTGCIGLIDSINKFDLGRNLKLITYSVWWIKSKIIEYIRENERIVAIPFNQQDELQKIEKYRTILENELCGEVGYDQAIERLLREEDEKEFQIQKKKVLENIVNLEETLENSYVSEDYLVILDEIPAPMRTLDNTPKTSEAYYEYIRPSIQAKYEPVSIDATINNVEDGDNRLSDFLPDKSANFLEAVVSEDRKKVLHRALSTLPEVNRRILSLYFGLDDGIARTNEDISELLGLTSERIRQLKNSSLQTLKTNRALLGVL